MAILLVAGCIALIAANKSFRAFEAQATTWVLSPFVPAQRAALDAHVLVRSPTNELLALHITIECTTLLIVLPLTAVAAVILAVSRVRWVRLFLGLAAMWVIALVVNLFRLALIGFSTQTWGLNPGYEVSHVFVGSVIGIFGYALGLAALLLIIGFRPRRDTAGFTPQYRRRRSLRP